MTRAIGDTTSTCGSCSYWEHIESADGAHPTKLGNCGYLSVPAWVHKYIPLKVVTRMREEEGINCWMHTKRDAPAGRVRPQLAADIGESK